jgi:hypothetical protein
MVGLLAASATAGEDRQPAKPTQKPKSALALSKAVERVALADKSPGSSPASKPVEGSPAASRAEPVPEETPIARAHRIIAECQARYRDLDDYTCTLFKRERIAGRLSPVHIMVLKVRTRPHSIYLKFQQPNRGREAIFVTGLHGGKLLAHDVGLGKLLAGTLRLDPTGSMAMEDCRHPITEAGIGPLLDTVSKRWAVELSPADSVMEFRDDMMIGERRCMMIRSTHPERRSDFLFHKVQLYIDQEVNLPIRFEAYDWPRRPGLEPELEEEYTYTQLKLNVHLTDRDFDTTNAAYSFGRF